MKREIGSEFWDVPQQTKKNSFFRADTRWFISGTAALEYILDDLLASGPIREAGIPSWCCSCMITPFLSRKIKVVFYPVWYDRNKGLSVDYGCTDDCDVTLCLNYFGVNYLNASGKPGGIIIEDLTHSLFSNNHRNGEYCFGSLRKWAGFYTGGYAWKDRSWITANLKSDLDINYVMLRKEAMTKKHDYIYGKTDSKDYLDLFNKGEEFLDACGIMPGFSEDEKKANYLDIEGIRQKRKENALIVLDSFKEHAVFKEIQEDDCPLFVPLLFPNTIRNELRSYLISRSIYCPIHWPVSEYHRLDNLTKKLYQQEISIICDQRYDQDDMCRIVDEMKAFLRRGSRC